MQSNYPLHTGSDAQQFNEFQAQTSLHFQHLVPQWHLVGFYLFIIFKSALHHEPQ